MYHSEVPKSNRSGYLGPAPGWLERRGDEIWLVVDRNFGSGLTAYAPSQYVYAYAPGTSLLSRPGVRRSDGTWQIQPDLVLVDYLRGYIAAPIAMPVAALKDATIESTDNEAIWERKYLDSTGAETGSVRITIGTDPGSLAIVSTGSVDVQGASTVIGAGASNGKESARKGDEVQVEIPATVEGGFLLQQLAVALLATGGFVPASAPVPTPPAASIRISGEITKGSESVKVRD